MPNPLKLYNSEEERSERKAKGFTSGNLKKKTERRGPRGKRSIAYLMEVRAFLWGGRTKGTTGQKIDEVENGGREKKGRLCMVSRLRYEEIGPPSELLDV